VSIKKEETGEEKGTDKTRENITQQNTTKHNKTQQNTTKHNKTQQNTTKRPGEWHESTLQINSNQSALTT
jgi:hypothetical protein